MLSFMGSQELDTRNFSFLPRVSALAGVYHVCNCKDPGVDQGRGRMPDGGPAPFASLGSRPETAGGGTPVDSGGGAAFRLDTALACC